MQARPTVSYTSSWSSSRESICRGSCTCGGPLAIADACEIVRQAAVGLQHSHEHGLVHRDVKPSNLMLATAGVVKVLDLGLARLQVATYSDGEATASGQIVGSPDYMAPEQGSNSQEADARADIYSLGCTLYFLLAGRPPFGNEGYNTLLQKVMAHAKEEAVPIQHLRPDVPSQVTAILDCMLAKNPADRYSTAAEVALALIPPSAGSNLIGLLENRRTLRPAAQTARNAPGPALRKNLPKSSGASAVPVGMSTRKLWLIGLGLLALVVALVVWVQRPEKINRCGAIAPPEAGWHRIGQVAHRPRRRST